MPGSVVLLTGRSFSGKSRVTTVVARRLAAAVVSYDAINDERGLQSGAGIPIEEWARTNDMAHERARWSLAQDRSIVVDDTSSPRSLRDAWRTLAAQHRAAFVLVFVDTDVDTIRRRVLANRTDGRRHDVADAVMEDHLRAFEPPSSAEPHLVVHPKDELEDVAEQIALILGASARAE